MTGLTSMLYIRTTMTIPGAGTAIHIAELQEFAPDNAAAGAVDTMCALHRMVALTPDEDIAGAAHVQQGQVHVVGNMDKPLPAIAHPNTYAQFPDIDAEEISQADFELLWARAATMFGQLGERA